MRYLANDELGAWGTVPVGPLIEEVFQEAQKHVSAEFAQLKYDKKAQLMTISGDRTALRRALFEIILNALQANLADPRIEIRIEHKPGTGGKAGLEIEIEDTGVGFSPEELEKAGTAFWTRRAVGMGLGLAVARKIVEMHHGKLEIRPAEAGHGGIVALWFPAESAESSESQPVPATARLFSGRT
jgi:signal transduction histidine kinase